MENKKPEEDKRQRHLAFTSAINGVIYFITTRKRKKKIGVTHYLIRKKYDKKNNAPYYRQIKISSKQIDKLIECKTDYETIIMCEEMFHSATYRHAFVWADYEKRFTIHNDMRKKGE